MKRNIINDVSDLVLKYNTRNPFTLCDYLNINLFMHNLGSYLKGYYLMYNNNHNIVINETLFKSEQTIVLGHELGHVMEHSFIPRAFSESNIGSLEDKIELEANLFCAELLIPDMEILSLIDENYSFYSICEELGFPEWLIDCKIRLLIDKGYNEFRYLYIVNRNSIRK